MVLAMSATHIGATEYVVPARDTALPPAGSDIFGEYGAAVTCASAVLLLLAIATIDRLTGSEIRLQILYLIPVAIVTWVAGRAWGFVLSVVAVGIWLATLHATHLSPGILYYWEAGVSLGTLGIFVFLIARLRDALESSNRRLLKVLDELDGPVYVADPRQGAVLYGNRRFHETLEGRPYEALNRLAAKECRIYWPDGRRVLLRIVS
jgi:PAS domain-containing protein